MIGLVLAAIAYPRVCRFPTPARVGGGRSPSTTRRFQKETSAAFTAEHGPTLLDYVPALVVRLGCCLDHHETRDGGLVKTAPDSGYSGVCSPDRLVSPGSTSSGNSSAE